MKKKRRQRIVVLILAAIVIAALVLPLVFKVASPPGGEALKPLKAGAGSPDQRSGADMGVK